MKDKLDTMFKDMVVTGLHVFSSASDHIQCQTTDMFDNVQTLSESSDEADEFSPQPNIRSTTNGKSKNVMNANKSQQFKKVDGRNKVDGAAKLSTQIDRLLNVIKTKSNTTYVVRKDMPGTSIAEVMEVIKSLPYIKVGDKLWHYATHLFLNKEKRQMFETMKKDRLRFC